MKPEVKASLEDLLQQRADQENALQQRALTEKARVDDNLEAFEAAKESIIRPAFIEIVKIYQNRGRPARILEQEEEVKSNGGTSGPYIRLNLEPDNASYNSSLLREEFTIHFKKSSREVWVHKSKRGSAGSGATLPLDSLSGDWVHEQFLEYASKPY